MAEPSFVSVVGWSDTGKTTLIVGALRECARRGIAASAAKRARHAPEATPAGKDSTLFLEAGARASIYIGERGMARFEPAPAKLDRAFFAAQFPGSAVIFLEGATVEGALRVLVAGGARSAAELKRPLEEVDLLVAGDEGLRALAAAAGVSSAAPGNYAALVDILEANYGK